MKTLHEGRLQAVTVISLETRLTTSSEPLKGTLRSQDILLLSGGELSQTMFSICFFLAFTICFIQAQNEVSEGISDFMKSIIQNLGGRF